MSRSFSTSSDHLDNSAPAATAPPFTMAIWVKFNSPTTAAAILSLGTNASGNNRFSLINQATGAIGATEFDTTTSQAVSSAVVSDTTSWHLLVGTWTDHTNRAAFLDGINKGTIAVLKAASAPNRTKISGTNANTVPLSGLAAHGTIWTGILSDSDIAQLATDMPQTVQKASILEYWSLTENLSPETSTGSLGNSLTVTGTTFSTDNPVFTKTLTPGVGAISLAGLAPTLSPKEALVQPGVGALAISGLAPAALGERLIQPGVGLAVIGGLAPTVVLPAAALTITPDVGIVSVAGLAPTVSIASSIGRRRRTRRLRSYEIPEQAELPITLPNVPEPGINPIYGIAPRPPVDVQPVLDFEWQELAELKRTVAQRARHRRRDDEDAIAQILAA